MRLLLVEDETEMAQLIRARIGGSGYIVDHVGGCADAETAVRVAPYALVLLDRRLPDGDGVTLIPTIRNLRPGLPVILVSALDAIADRVSGLDGGADDYLTKPFDGDELLARIRTVLRRPAVAVPAIRVGDLEYDPGSRQASIRRVPIVLRRRELSVLDSLVRRVGRVVLRETLLEEMFGFDDDIQSNTLDAHVSRLRTRLVESGAGIAIHPVRGVGYFLDLA